MPRASAKPSSASCGSSRVMGSAWVALHGVPPAFAEVRRREPFVRPGPRSGLGRCHATKQMVHISDVAAEQAYRDREPLRIALVEQAGARTIINVPMLKEDELIGVISIYRQEVRPFTDRQIVLVQNFAEPGRHRHREYAPAQRAARIAAAADRHRRRAQGHQSVDFRPASRAQIRWLNRRPGSAKQTKAYISRPKGAAYYFEASYGLSPEFAEYVANHPARMDRASATGRVLLERKIVHVPDVLADPEYTYAARGRLAAFAPSLASHSCEKECQLVLSFWRATRCGHSLTSKSSW